MEKKETLLKLDSIIKQLNEQYQYLSENQDKFNETQIELLAASANFLTDHIKIVSGLNKEAAAPEPLKEETVAEQLPVAENAGSHEIVDKKEHVANNKGPEVKHPELSNEISDEETVVHEVVIREKTISVDTPIAEKQIIPTLNDLISAQRNQSTVGSSYGNQPVKDLKSIISMNDKLQFVKDLFKGYNLAYSEAIEVLNRFDNFEAAENFLKNNYAVKNNWAEKQATVDKFYEILNRRFSK